MQKRISAKFEELDSENPDSAFQSPNVAAHQLVLTQAEDPDWSPVVDQALADRLNADLGGQFNVASIDCRTDICELRVSGYTPMDAEDNFQKDIYELQHQGWFNTYGLHLENFMMSGVGNGGPSLFIVYLTRK